MIGGLALALAAAVAINWSYVRQHDAVASLPHLSLARPREFAAHLLGSRAWLATFGAQGLGWACYLAALRLAPISLVQGIGASGIAVIAFVSTRGHPGRLSRAEQVAVVAGFLGLLLLALSLTGNAQSDEAPAPAAVSVWLAATIAGGLFLALPGRRIARAASLGLASGLLLAGGDICSKLVVLGHAWIAAAVPLLAAYAVGTAFLQAAFQHGQALTAAGLSTLATNAVPIAAGFSLFGEQLPGAWQSILQVIGFGVLIGSAILLARPGSR
jgi:drug/metabolite transporter (DMT)-like permease